MPEADVSLPPRKTLATIVAIFVACTLLTYGSSLNNSFVSWDDKYLIYENPIITRINPQTIKAAFTSYDPELYVPLTTLSYQVDYAMGGLNPTGYHLQNLMWHTLNSLLVAWLLYALFGHGIVAVVLGLLFALHPLNVEAVAWAAARKDVLSTFFFLSSILSYLRWRETDSKNAYRLSVAAFVVGLMAKVMIVTLPLVLLLVDWKQDRRITIASVIEKWPYFAASLLFGVIAIFGKTQTLVITTLDQKILMAFKSAWFSLTSFIAPVHLSVLYPYHGAIGANPDFLLPLAALLVVCTIAAASLRRTRDVAFGLAFFLLTLSPTFINFAKGNELYVASDRYSYIPMVGLLCVLAWLLSRIAKRDIGEKAVVSVGAVAIALSGLLAHAQAATWADSATLYNHVLRFYPKSIAARNNLAMEYIQTGREDEAISIFDAMLEEKQLSRTYVNRGIAKLHKGDTAGAVEDYKTAIRMDEKQHEAYYALGNVLYRQSRYGEAAAFYEKAIEIDPKFMNAYNNLGACYLQMQRWDEAAEAFGKLLELNPVFAEAYYNLGVVEEQRGNAEEAIEMFSEALRLNPLDADARTSLEALRGVK